MQIVIRTYPHKFTNETTRLSKALENGYRVVMCNQFYYSTDGAVMGNEYILEKEGDENG